MSTLLTVLIFTAALAVILLAVEQLDRALDETFPSYGRAWAAAFGEDVPEQPQHVRVISPDACAFCHSRALHRPGCPQVDHPDAVRVTHHNPRRSP